MIVTGYQTLEDKNNVDYFEQNGPHKCTSGSSWLGFGYYFWDTEMEWAHNWGRSKYREYVIFQAKLRIDESTFDLYGNVEHQRLALEWRSEILKKYLKTDASTLTVFNIIEYAKKWAKFDETYYSIRAADYPPKQTKIPFIQGGREFAILGGIRVQHCLINKKNLISHSFRISYPEKYLV